MNVEFGYALSSEECRPNELVRNASMAEQHGMSFAMISDHFHPWIGAQGQSPFTWSVLGAIAHATSTMKVGTGVTCPTVRYHPAIVAQASATVASMMPGRFFLSVGSGEALNEHILGRHWPPPPQRLEMLAEAISIIRRLWSGEEVTHRGEHFTVEDAQLYTLPDQPPPLNVAASGSLSATLAGANDGLVATSPSRDLVASFDAAGGRSKPKYGQLTVCWGRDRSQAIRTAAKQWPNVLIPGQLNAEIARPAYFEMLTKEPDLDKLAKLVACGPDPRPFLDMMHKYTGAGFDHLCFHQVGPDQEGFLRFFETELAPAFRNVAPRASAIPDGVPQAERASR
ncbi:MAG TPA: TIGR03557 family F420-dependent LLM class oxidoreductase [Tepidiformaceae bacterium]|nr:TIGR03557 family F420-dependent LLM class oxidoreductase [Tepidiformaceae bacterium]